MIKTICNKCGDTGQIFKSCMDVSCTGQLESQKIDQGFVAVKVEDLERWSSIQDTYENKEPFKIRVFISQMEMKKYLGEKGG